MPTDDISPNLPSDHKYTPFAQDTPRSNYDLDFNEYSSTLEFLKNVKEDPDLRSQVTARIESEWRPAVATALDLFNQRLRCKKCNSTPGTSGFRHRLSADGQRRLDALISEMRGFPVERLDQAKFAQFQKRLRNLEREHLNENLGATCKGLASTGN
jgi:hypothetical protein